MTGAQLEGAVLWGAHLEGAHLEGAHLEGAHLEGAHLEAAYLDETYIEGADLSGANLQDANVYAVAYDRNTKCRGIRVDSCYGSPMFKRFAQDQDFLEELQKRSWWGKPLYYIWLVLADCGRTPWRWVFWSVLFAIWFALNFYWLGPDAFRLAGNGLDPSDPSLPFTLGTTIYYSVVTFTTLGFGDITPKTPTAAWWVMAEVIVGYIMLGGLISIMATLVARRSS